MREALRGKRRKTLDIYATEAAARRLEGEIADAGLSPHIVTADDLGSYPMTRRRVRTPLACPVTLVAASSRWALDTWSFT